QPNNISGDSWEHHEPWPGGRFNHYLFDLNRDWCWQTQVESQQRAKVYQQWMPHVHVDFHEMGAESHYFFAPSAKPFHDVITPWQREFHQIIGKNHAKYFDQNSWLYFTKESYDLLYPSYGDSWPTYQGAMGFTYEQGGSGRAGLELKLENSPGTISLKDRLAHHFTTSLSTIETAHQNQKRLIEEFNRFFAEAISNPPGEYKAYIISSDNEKASIKHLLRLMDQNKISYGYPKSTGKTLKGFAYQSGAEESFELSEKDIIIPTNQPNSRLVKVLFEPSTQLEDSITYDLTAWALPYAYDLKAYAAASKINISDQAVTFPFAANEMNAAKPYAYLAEWKDVSDVAFLGQLIKAGIHVRKTDLPFQIKGKKYERGTLIITRRDNPGEDFDKKLLEVANQQQKVLIPQTTGMVDSGHDFGSGDVPYIKPPKVAIVNGNGVSPTAFGELWHYFEQDLKFPVTVIHTDYLGRVDLGEYDVLVLVSGNYGEFQSKILSFVKEGGKAIAIEGAIDVFTASGNDDPTNLGKAVSGQSRRTEFSLNRNDPLAKYGDRDRTSLSNFVAGSIYKVTLDETHPLAYGQDQHTYILKRNRDAFPYLSSGGWNVGVFKGEASVSGFTGYKLKKSLEDSFSIGEESYGRGKIVYFSDSPVIRGFWHSGKLLLGNAVFY
ncbi:MAG: zinc carboxypeptidase, partial [Bacteroidetes bacterium]|nr:zinc carboxypeptidase [Bacteroidota bacterium]